MLPWPEHPEWDRKLLELRHPQTSYLHPANLRFTGQLAFADVARRMNAWFCVSCFTKDNCQKRYALLTPPPSLRDFPPAIPTPYLSRFFDADGQLYTPAPEKLDLRGYVRGLEESGRWYKTLVLSDTQGCFADDALVDQAMDEHPDADLIVLPGDVNDWEGASRYVHTRDYPLVYECDWYVRLLVALSERYPGIPVVVTDSNHRRRVSNAVRQLPPGLLFLVEANPEKYLAQPFANVFALDKWWWQSGDVIYAHAEGKTAEGGDNAKAAIDGFLNKLAMTTAYGLPEEHHEYVNQFRVVLTGHSHKVYKGLYKTILGIEPGALAKMPMEYTTSASSLKTVQENGYAVIVQRAGRADLNACQAVILRDAQPAYSCV